ncbi:MAG: DNRLRE domain-containing protein [Syntrophomonas sp.]
MTVITLRPSLSTYISSWYPDQNFSSSTALFAGRFMNAQDLYRSLLQFNLSNIPPISTIDSAQLNLYMYDNQVGIGGAFIRVQSLFTSWSQNTVTWGNQPGTNPPGMNRVWDGSVYISPSTSDGFVNIDISDLVRKWIDGSIPNHGLQLAGNELENSLFRFWSPNYNYSYAGPSLTVNLELGLLGIYDRQNLLIPRWPTNSVASAPLTLGPSQLATFMLENTSSSTRVEARLEVGEDSKFNAAGPWHSLEACGNPGASAALSTAYPVKQARVLLRGAGGEIINITPHSRE